MSPLSLKLIQVGFLVLLWVLVLSVAAVMRTDLFARRRARSRSEATRARPVAPAHPPIPSPGLANGGTVPVADGVAGSLGAGVPGRAGQPVGVSPGVPAGDGGAPTGAPTSAVSTGAVPAAGAGAAAGRAGRQPKPSRPPKPRRGAPRELVVTAGTGVGTRIELGASPISIGRAPENTLVLDDDYVSGRHARLFPHEGAWVVEDLGSTNGTYLDRSKLSAPMVVPVGTSVRIGKTILELRK